MIPPCLKWPGSKFSIAPWIAGFAPRTDAYLEPYYGGGGVHQNVPPYSCEIINDRDGEVVNFWRCVRDCGPQLADLLSFTPWSRDEYDRCRKQMAQPFPSTPRRTPPTREGNAVHPSSPIPHPDVERARVFAVVMWMAIGQRRSKAAELGGAGSSGTSGWRNRHTKHGACNATWHRLPERVQQAGARLMHTQIENRPALDCITRLRDKEVLIYADPPYLLSTRSRALYAYELSEADHVLLLEALQAHPGPVLLSGYHSELYAKRLKKWECRYTYSTDQATKRRREYLWLNPACVKRLAKSRAQKTMF